MNVSTRVALVLLRLAIGWHFLFEGLEKVHSVYVGPTETNKPWTSEGYFREASGPLAPFFRGQIGDPDAEALAKLTLLPDAGGEKPGAAFAHRRTPSGIAREWDAYADRLAAHYRLDGKQRDVLAAKLTQLKDSYVNWLLTTVKDVKRAFPAGTVDAKQSLADRVKEYEAKVAEAKHTLDRKLYAFGADVEGPKLRALKGEVKQLRDELMSDVAAQTKAAKEAMQAAVEAVLTDKQKELPAPEEPAPARPVERIDFLTRWGLVVVGSCLMLGLFSRLSALAAAGFLAMIYLSAPPLPWLPTPPNTEGHYTFVNKNLIELLALLALATVPSGKWFGMDYGLEKINPFRRRQPAAD